eukprot:21121-Pelagococcus_subviridis.AAC.4
MFGFARSIDENEFSAAGFDASCSMISCWLGIPPAPAPAPAPIPPSPPKPPIAPIPPKLGGVGAGAGSR